VEEVLPFVLRQVGLDVRRDQVTLMTHSRHPTKIRNPKSEIPNKESLLSSLSLLPYQSAFAANDARFKIGLWARQTGKDHTATAEAVIDCLYNPGAEWIILAACERQALESLSKAKDWAEILKFRIDDYTECPPNLPLAQAQARSTEIKWSNGSRLIALPRNPDTARGYTGNFILTEFAFHENAHAIWGAIYPSITNPLRGGLKKIRIISTPNGLTNKFAELWRGNELSGLPDPYHRSRLTIHDAIRNGLPLDPAELQAGLNDADAWSQEYLCEFMDSSSVMFPYDLIAPCESEQATESGSLLQAPGSGLRLC
jgi:phage FluMu gp28-like protein